LLAVGVPYEHAGGTHPLEIALLAALPIGLVTAWIAAGRLEKRLARLSRFAQQVERGETAAFLAAERPDAMGDLE